MARNQRVSNTKQPLAFGSFANWLKLLWSNGNIDRVHLRRVLFVSLLSACTIPLRLLERLRYARRLARTSIEQPPIFILGHWRSGTTHLHYLLCQDKSLGSVSTFQTIAPEFFLIGHKTIRPILALLTPSTRMVDNMALSLDTPQEEEFAIANTSPYSFYHHWSFPQRARHYFEKYVLFQDVPETVISRWKELYLRLLRKATLSVGHKRLILKNPTNTGRIKLLLELFPKAKFINIYRNPYLVFLSTRHLYRKVLDIAQLQRISEEEIEANILQFYQRLLRKFFAERDLIPAENYVDLRFEDLEADPIGELGRVYESLGLDGFSEREAAFRAYLASQADYRKNQYEIARSDIEKVNRHWHFALAEWGYERLVPSGGIVLPS